MPRLMPRPTETWITTATPAEKKSIGLFSRIGDVDIEAVRTDAIQRLSDYVIFREGAWETLTWLQENQYLLGIITNGDAWGQRRKLNRLGIESFFQCITISGVFGVKKPDSSIFHHTLKELGVEAEESLFVGDHPEKDIQGSLDAGMIPVWIKSAYYQPPGPNIHKIESLLELPPLLEKMNS